MMAERLNAADCKSVPMRYVGSNPTHLKGKGTLEVGKERKERKKRKKVSGKEKERKESKKSGREREDA